MYEWFSRKKILFIFKYEFPINQKVLAMKVSQKRTSLKQILKLMRLSNNKIIFDNEMNSKKYKWLIATIAKTLITLLRNYLLRFPLTPKKET